MKCITPEFYEQYETNCLLEYSENGVHNLRYREKEKDSAYVQRSSVMSSSMPVLPITTTEYEILHAESE